MASKMTIEDVEKYQEKMKVVKANGFKAADFKALGREMQQEFNDLTVPEITAILNNRPDEILAILKKHK